jgi:hypothetical protein
MESASEFAHGRCSRCRLTARLKLVSIFCVAAQGVSMKSPLQSGNVVVAGRETSVSLEEVSSGLKEFREA